MPNGNRVRGGIEIDDRGQHVAYHVRNGLGLEWDRIEAHDKRGWLRAYMYKSKEYRLDDPRAIPKTVQSMESSKQLDEYTSATVGSAVERQRISYFIQHEKGSEGVDPRAADLAKIIGTGGNMDLPKDINGEQIANTIAVSTNKKTFNLAPGSTIMAPDSKQELHYAEFHGTRFDSIAAASDIPPEVASQKYGGSYSASRAATNGFQYSLNIDRGKLGKGFYQPIFDLQLNMWVLTNKINAPGYIEALAKNNKIVLGAYRHAKWLGDPVPQIDELNEVKAARLKLGKGYDNVPLTTAQKIAHNLGDGNFSANLLQAQRELDEMAKTGIKPAELAAAPDNAKQEDNEEEDQKKKVK
jgi:capsid protein